MAEVVGGEEDEVVVVGSEVGEEVVEGGSDDWVPECCIVSLMLLSIVGGYQKLSETICSHGVGRIREVNR